MTTVITDPVTEDTHYGIPVCHIGEDGNMLALGHPGKRKAFAAFNRHARVFCGLPNLADDFSARLADWKDSVEEQWVVFRRPDPDSEFEDPEYEWYFDAASADDPNSQPVTILRVRKETPTP